MRRPIRLIVAAAAAALLVSACSDPREVGSVSVDWTGNDVVVEAVSDPQVAGVICHVAYFNRSLIDRVQQGNWFEDPSWSALDCVANGPITIGNIGLGRGGDEIFREQRSLIWKSLRVTRIYDGANDALVYLAHSRELQMGSGKMSISTVPLSVNDVTWSRGKPAPASTATLAAP